MARMDRHPLSRASRSRGFEAIAGNGARVLVLGSLPGQASLAAGEYYANPRNGFWRIVADLFQLSADLSYRERTARLAAAGVALWDVCEAAHRPGSLDSAIARASVVPNDFAGFFGRHGGVRRVCFNGARAAALYRALVLPRLPGGLQSIRCQTLPSTSPAHASMPYAEKLARWTVVREACGD